MKTHPATCLNQFSTLLTEDKVKYKNCQTDFLVYILVYIILLVLEIFYKKCTYYKHLNKYKIKLWQVRLCRSFIQFNTTLFISHAAAHHPD